MTIVPRLFCELVQYQGLSAADTATLIHRARHLPDGMSRTFARNMIRVTFQRRRPWRERVATRPYGLAFYLATLQHSPETSARIVSLCQNVR
jgi:hypothetical protein